MNKENELVLAKIMIGVMAVSMVASTVVSTKAIQRLISENQKQNKNMRSLVDSLLKHVPVEFLEKVKNEMEFSDIVEVTWPSAK